MSRDENDNIMSYILINGVFKIYIHIGVKCVATTAKFLFFCLPQFSDNYDVQERLIK